MGRNPNCTDCRLHKIAQYVCLWGCGPKRSDVMIVGEGPGQREDDTGRAFVGRAGQVLDRALEAAQLNREDIYITNATKCKPGDKKPRSTEIHACKKYLDEEIASVKPKFVALLGNIALESVLGYKGIKKYRGRAVEKDGIIYFPIYHPSFILRGDGKDYPVFEQDFHTFAKMIGQGGIPEDRELNSVVINDESSFQIMVESLTGVVSFDIETTCLYPWAPEAKIVTVGFGTEDGEYHLFPRHYSKHQFKSMLQETFKKIADDCILVTQFGKFDAVWMKVHYDTDIHIDFDDGMAHYLIDENDKHDLVHIAQLYFGAHDWDITLEEKQGKYLDLAEATGHRRAISSALDRLAKYHAFDLYYTRKAYFPLKERLKADQSLWRLFLNLTMPCVNQFVKMELNGAYVDVKRMDEAGEYLQKEIASTEKSLKKWGDISWTSPKQVGNLLYGKLKIKCPVKTKKGGLSVSESALNQIDHPCVADLKRLRAARQENSFFVEGWRPYIVDHRLHPHFKLHGAVTGRPSCEHPNFQQTTREKRIRSLIGAQPGFECVEADLSQIELRVVAELSCEPNLMRAFREGVDVHWLTAMREIERGAALKDLVIKTAKKVAMIDGKLTYGDAIQVMLMAGPDACTEVDDNWKEYRKKAKAVNFGYVFGMWWKKFRQYARDNYGIELTDEEAKSSREAFFNMYGLESWHKEQRRYAQHRGYVRTLTGQKRRLPDATSHDDTPQRAEAWRQAINSPVQGFAAHLCLMVLLQTSAEFSSDVFRPFATVHDAILSEVRKDFVEKVVLRLEEIMKSPKLLKTFGIELTVPICGEVKIGPWGSGVSLSKWRDSHGMDAGRSRTTSDINKARTERRHDRQGDGQDEERNIGKTEQARHITRSRNVNSLRYARS